MTHSISRHELGPPPPFPCMVRRSNNRVLRRIKRKGEKLGCVLERWMERDIETLEDPVHAYCGQLLTLISVFFTHLNWPLTSH